eukprot:m51a1_g5976 putative heat shock protein hsp20 (221) ;mRNA; r:241891-242553
MSLFSDFGLFADPFAQMRRMEREMDRLSRRMDSILNDDALMDVDDVPQQQQQQQRLENGAPSSDSANKDGTSGAVATTQQGAVQGTKQQGAVAKRSGRGCRSVAAWRPRVDVKETEKEYVVRAELPGVKKEDVSVEVRRDGPTPMLVLHGSKREETADKTDKWHRVERSFGEFTRSFALPDGVQPEQLAAKYEDGVLELTVPKPPQAQKPAENVHRITIN